MSTDDPGQWDDDSLFLPKDVNPEPAVPCVLVVDTSASMEVAGRIHRVEQGIRDLVASLRSHPDARDRVELLVVTFGGRVKVHGDFESIDSFQPPSLKASGSTQMGAAVISALDAIERRRAQLKLARRGSYQPWIFLVTDGLPGSKAGPDRWFPQAARRLKTDIEGRKVLFVGFMVDRRLSVDHLRELGDPNPKILGDGQWEDLFRFISVSVSSIAKSGSIGPGIIWMDSN